jgi:hypothetical protein|tara:strand:+ start:688 stop:849 length:162 start_codon:yes stop_codon:yes gene_type:complete
MEVVAAPPPTFWTSSNNAKIIISRVKKLMLSFNFSKVKESGKRLPWRPKQHHL